MKWTLPCGGHSAPGGQLGSPTLACECVGTREEFREFSLLFPFSILLISAPMSIISVHLSLFKCYSFINHIRITEPNPFLEIVEAAVIAARCGRVCVRVCVRSASGPAECPGTGAGPHAVCLAASSFSGASALGQPEREEREAVGQRGGFCGPGPEGGRLPGLTSLHGPAPSPWPHPSRWPRPSPWPRSAHGPAASA